LRGLLGWHKRAPSTDREHPPRTLSLPQIHNWAADLQDKSTPSLEFVSVGKSYVVVNGVKTFLDVSMVRDVSYNWLGCPGL